MNLFPSAFAHAALPLAAVAALAAFAGPALAQSMEFESNDSKVLANFRFLPGDGTFALGTTTGSTGTGLTSPDYLRVTVFGRPPGVYRNRVTITSPTPGHTGSIRGLMQTSSFVSTLSDVGVQTSQILSGTTRFNQFYSGLTNAEFYYRITGTPATTAGYTVALESSPVTLIELGTLRAGPITISTANQGHTTDTEIRVFGFPATTNGFGNDDFAPGSLQSTFNFNAISGTFLIAVSDFNLCDNRASIEGGEFFRDGNILDFLGLTLCSSPAANLNVSFTVSDSQRTITVPATKQGPFDVVWARFSVADFTCPVDFNDDGVLSPDDLDEFITTYFTPPPDNAAADFNADGVVSPDDLDDFITAYFEGCG